MSVPRNCPSIRDIPGPAGTCHLPRAFPSQQPPQHAHRHSHQVQDSQKINTFYLFTSVDTIDGIGRETAVEVDRAHLSRQEWHLGVTDKIAGNLNFRLL